MKIIGGQLIVDIDSEPRETWGGGDRTQLPAFNSFVEENHDFLSGDKQQQTTIMSFLRDIRDRVAVLIGILMKVIYNEGSLASTQQTDADHSQEDKGIGALEHLREEPLLELCGEIRKKFKPEVTKEVRFQELSQLMKKLPPEICGEIRQQFKPEITKGVRFQALSRRLGRCRSLDAFEKVNKLVETWEPSREEMLEFLQMLNDSRQYKTLFVSVWLGGTDVAREVLLTCLGEINMQDFLNLDLYECMEEIAKPSDSDEASDRLKYRTYMKDKGFEMGEHLFSRRVTPLILAAKVRSVSHVKSLLEHINPDVVNCVIQPIAYGMMIDHRKSCTALIAAIEKGNQEMVKMLLKHGAQVQYPMLPHFEFSEYIAPVRARSHDPVRAFEQGDALDAAIRYQREDILKILLDKAVVNLDAPDIR